MFVGTLSNSYGPVLKRYVVSLFTALSPHV